MNLEELKVFLYRLDPVKHVNLNGEVKVLKRLVKTQIP